MYRIVFSSLLGKKKYNCHLFLSSIFVRRAKLACCFSFLILANQSYDFFAINKAQECHGGGAARKPGIFFQTCPAEVDTQSARAGWRDRERGQEGRGDNASSVSRSPKGRSNQLLPPAKTSSPTRTLLRFFFFFSPFVFTFPIRAHWIFVFFLVVFVQLSRPFSLCFQNLVGCCFVYCFVTPQVEPTAVSPLEQNECH